MDAVARVIIVIACLLLLGALGEYIFKRTRVPDVVWLVAAGILAGPVFKILPSEFLAPGIPFFGAVALTVILSGGAFRLRISEIAAAAPRGILLGLVGFGCSMLAIAAFFWLATGLGVVPELPVLAWLTAGAIVAGTSSVIIMPTMALGRAPSSVTHLLEVESSATDALSVIVTMMLIDLMVTGNTDLSRPVITLARQLCIGVVLGLVAAALFVPGIPALRDQPHGYTVFLALMLALYGLCESFGGNGAMAVLVASLLLGNASSIVPRLFPGAHGEVFTASAVSQIMQDQITFLIKSFFFFLIGLMFPTDLRLIALSGLAVLFLLGVRIPAVLIATVGTGLSKREAWLLNVAIPRGLAAGVLATLPTAYGVPGADSLAPSVFAMIVLSVLVFTIGFSVVSRWPEERSAP